MCGQSAYLFGTCSICSGLRQDKRPASTSASIDLSANGFLGRPMRSKGFANRHNHVAWAVLAHNLWVIARLPLAEEKLKEQAKAA